MQSIRVTDTGIVYRNPKPHLRAIHAMHPSISRLRSGELVATFDIGQGPESLDYHTVLSRSVDGGRSWGLQGPLIRPPKGRCSTHTIRTSVLSNGRMIGLGGLFYRDDPEQGLVNRANLGYVPMDLFVVESRDSGRSWSTPRLVQAPFYSPAWEVCHPVRELANGDLIAPMSTWRGWDGALPCGEQSGMLISTDGGHTWPVWGRAFDGRESGCSHWEQGVVQLADGRIASVAWVYDPDSGKTKPSLYTTSSDGGRAFALPRPTGFLAQTCKLLHVHDDIVLAAYRRDDQPGLWANLARVRGDGWTNLCQVPLWRGARSGMEGQGNQSEELSGLKFGFPQMTKLSESEVLLVFWCMEDDIKNIRWIRLRVTS